MKKKKKILSVLIAGLMVMALVPMTSLAKPEPVATIGDAGFNTLLEALQTANANPGSTVEIQMDTCYDSTILTTSDVTINLNGHTISRSSSEVRWYVGCIEEYYTMGLDDPDPEDLPHVVINGDGAFINGDTCDFSTQIFTPLLTVAYADFEMNDVYMYDEINYDDASAFDVREGATVVLNNCNITGNSAVKIFREEGYVDSDVTINNCVLNCISKSDSIYKGDAILATYYNNFSTTLTVNDTLIQSLNTAAVNLSADCNSTFNNCVISGPTGIFFKSGSLTLNGTTVTAGGDYVEEVATGPELNTPRSEEPVWNGSGIEVDTDNKYGEPIDVVISEDSTVTSANGYGITEVGGYDGTSLVQVQAEGKVSGALGEISLYE